MGWSKRNFIWAKQGKSRGCKVMKSRSRYTGLRILYYQKRNQDNVPFVLSHLAASPWKGECSLQYAWEFASPKACGQCLCHCTKYWGSHVCLASRKATSKRCTCREQLPECAEERHLEIETDGVRPWESSQGQCVGTVLWKYIRRLTAGMGKGGFS